MGGLDFMSTLGLFVVVERTALGPSFVLDSLCTHVCRTEPSHSNRWTSRDHDVSLTKDQDWWECPRGRQDAVNSRRELIHKSQRLQL